MHNFNSILFPSIFPHTPTIHFLLGTPFTSLFLSELFFPSPISLISSIHQSPLSFSLNPPLSLSLPLFSIYVSSPSLSTFSLHHSSSLSHSIPSIPFSLFSTPHSYHYLFATLFGPFLFAFVD